MERKNNHHYCNFCTKSFMTVGSRNDHERNVHEKLRPHKCDQCGKRFYRKFNLMSHKRKHSTDYSHSCKICDKRFRSDLSVKVHMKTHTNHRPFMCEVCGKVFKTLSVLEAHNNIHTKQTKYDCRLCEKSYSYRASLFLHMRTHTGQRPYQCKDCNASFIVKSHLTDHKRTHTRERPFECKYCLSSFARKVSLKKHLNSHIRAGLQVNIEEALLHQQSKSKGPSVTLSNKNLPIVSDTTLASRKTISLDHSVESIIVYTNLPPEEDELVTVVISCKKREGSCCSVKDPSVYLDHHSQKVIVESAYDTGYEIADHESCVSEVVKSEENSPFALSSIAGEGFEGLQILNEDIPISVPNVSIVCEVKDTSLHQLPSNCVACPNNISVSPSNTDRPSLTSQAVLRKVEDVARISTKYDNKHISEENKLIDSISETDIQGLLSDFDDRQSVCVKTIKQVNATKEEAIIDDLKFQADKSISCVIESKTPICETREDKSNFVRKCKYCCASYRYLACLKIHEEMHKQGDLRISTKNVDSHDSFVQFEKITNQTPLVVDSNHPFTCEVCGAGFSFRSELRKHVKLHSLKYCYVCKKCNQAFQQEVFLTRHKCLSSDSSSVFTIQSLPSVHEHLIETKKITQEFMCCKCRTVIEIEDNLNVNDSLTGILCNKCQDRDISSKHELSYENRLSHSKNELEVKQNKDESESEYPVELKFVEEILDQEKPNKTQDQSENSLHLVDNLHDVIDDMKDVVCLDESLSLPLDDCGLEVTIQTDNQDLKKKDSNKLRKFRKGKFSELMRCQYCPMLFKYNSTLRTHERIHTGEKPFSCSVCSKTFSKKSNMKLHQRIHTGERSFLCDYCGKYFSYKSSLDAHKQLHTNELPYICIICGKGFRYESSRSVHLKRHMGNKAFKCDFCPKAFVSKVEMEDHRRMHTGEKPYQCNDCGRSFSYRHHLVDHHRIHTGHKPYRCHVCNVYFSRWGMLKSHLQKHSGAVNP